MKIKVSDIIDMKSLFNSCDLIRSTHSIDNSIMIDFYINETDYNIIKEDIGNIPYKDFTSIKIVRCIQLIKSPINESYVLFEGGEFNVNPEYKGVR